MGELKVLPEKQQWFCPSHSRQPLWPLSSYLCVSTPGTSHCKDTQNPRTALENFSTENKRALEWYTVPAHLILWQGKTGCPYLDSDSQQELLHIGMDTGQACRGCVFVGGRNNFRMARTSRMPAGAGDWKKCTSMASRHWGEGLLQGRAGLQQCPPMFPWKQLLMHRECYQANSQATNKQISKQNPQTSVFQDYGISLKKTLISWQGLSWC